MRPNTSLRNETALHRHRSSQFIHSLSSCLSLAMSNRLSSRRTNLWSEGAANRCASRLTSSQTRSPLQSLSPILNSSDTYICCSYSPRCFIIQKVRSTPFHFSVHLFVDQRSGVRPPSDVLIVAIARVCHSQFESQHHRLGLKEQAFSESGVQSYPIRPRLAFEQSLLASKHYTFCLIAIVSRLPFIKIIGHNLAHISSAFIAHHI